MCLNDHVDSMSQFQFLLSGRWEVHFLNVGWLVSGLLNKGFWNKLSFFPPFLDAFPWSFCVNDNRLTDCVQCISPIFQASLLFLSVSHWAGIRGLWNFVLRFSGRNGCFKFLLRIIPIPGPAVLLLYRVMSRKLWVQDSPIATPWSSDYRDHLVYLQRGTIGLHCGLSLWCLQK